ncbi:aspartate/glutamate racemase family protein [Kribbella jiaozuonensis]|uniref:Hydantoin racemase n=1 Tax=Kribbella jiaozuonensis TaxID=2575441 RepID=A0A4V5UXT2_9ACTN|nr:aspartate/glutamate racemase family protein [Kribbella jiaozuonensis]TKK81893.1 hydantoin racemase [Kribbella jiaozuonensis]
MPGTVLVINPNTNKQTTAMMTDLIRPALSAAGLTVEGITVAHGPRMLADPAALAAAGPHVLHAVRHRLTTAAGVGAGGEVVAVIVAAIGDPGRELLDGVLDVPVVGIGQASILAAARGGQRFGMATSTPLLADSLVDLVAQYGHSDTFIGVRLTTSDPLVLAADPERQFLELADAVRACVADGAESVIIAGGPLAATARRLAELDLAPIIEPLPSAAALVIAAVDNSPGGTSRGG